MNPKVILYHGNCFDGFTAAWVASKRHPDATFIPMIYGAEVPDIPENADLFMLDFSLPKDVLVEILKRSNSLVILDHHKTAQAALADFPNAVFDMDKSGAQLAWEYFFPLDPNSKPPLVDYVADRDLWRFALPGSREINAFIQSTDLTFEAWDDISDFLLLHPQNVLALGASILRAQKTLVRQIVNQAVVRNFAQVTGVPVVNGGPLLMSEVGEALLETFPDAPFAASYYDRKDGRRSWSLRSEESRLDVSAVAKSYGGGGHRNAAGFETHQLWTP